MNLETMLAEYRVANAIEKPRYSAKEVKAHLIKTNQWPKDADDKPKAKPKSKQLKLQTKCQACNGTGTFVGKWERPCFRCKGKGHMDAADHARYATRLSKIKTGTQTIHFDVFEKSNGDNHWESAA